MPNQNVWDVELHCGEFELVEARFVVSKPCGWRDFDHNISARQRARVIFNREMVERILTQLPLYLETCGGAMFEDAYDDAKYPAILVGCICESGPHVINSPPVPRLGSDEQRSDKWTADSLHAYTGDATYEPEDYLVLRAVRRRTSR